MTMTRETPENDLDCPSCGMPREDWPDDEDGGYAKDGATYCCRGCVEGPGCTCVPVTSEGADRAPTRAEIRRDPASGEFVQSLQHQTDHVTAEDYGSEKLSKAPPPSGGLD